MRCALKKSSYSLCSLSDGLSGLGDGLMVTWVITRNNSHRILSCTCCTDCSKIPDLTDNWTQAALTLHPENTNNFYPATCCAPKPGHLAFMVASINTNATSPLWSLAETRSINNLIPVHCGRTSNPVDLILHGDKGNKISCAWVWPSLLTCPLQTVHAQRSGSAVGVTKS